MPTPQPPPNPERNPTMITTIAILLVFVGIPLAIYTASIAD